MCLKIGKVNTWHSTAGIGRRKSSVKCKCKFTIKNIRRTLNSTSGRVGGSLIQTADDISSLQNILQPRRSLRYLYIRGVYGVCLRIYVSQSNSSVVSLVQRGWKFYDCCSSNNLARSPASLIYASLSLSPPRPFSTCSTFHFPFLLPLLSLSLCFSLSHRLVKLHTLYRFYVSSGFSVPVRCHYTPHKAEHCRPAIFSPETRYHWPRKSIPLEPRAPQSHQVTWNIISRYVTRMREDRFYLCNVLRIILQDLSSPQIVSQQYLSYNFNNYLAQYQLHFREKNR